MSAKPLKLLRSPDNPGGWPLGKLLRALRLEVEGEALRAPEGGPAYAIALQVAGLLLAAEGIDAEAAAAGHGIGGFAPPRLVPRR